MVHFEKIPNDQILLLLLLRFSPNEPPLGSHVCGRRRHQSTNAHNFRPRFPLSTERLCVALLAKKKTTAAVLVGIHLVHTLLFAGSYMYCTLLSVVSCDQ